MNGRRCFGLFGLLILILLVASCAPAAEGYPSEAESAIEETAPQDEELAPAEEAEQPAFAEEAGETDLADEAEEAAGADQSNLAAPATAAPTALPSPASTQDLPTPTPVIEPRKIELEWPNRIHLGDSDVVRLAIIPTDSGYSLTTEFPDHQTITQDVPIVRPSGYDLFAVARLEGVNFDIAPSGEQAYHFPEGQPVTWHWSLTPKQPGNHRLTISLSIRWVPNNATSGDVREGIAYSKGLDVYVPSFLGLTRGQAMTTGFFGAIIGSAISLFGLLRKPKSIRRAIEVRSPNAQVSIELPANLNLEPAERQLLQTLFYRYHKLTVLQEFRSGYSGARTFLLLPHRSDGRTDAHTIAKIGHKNIIHQEFTNFETHVKHTLPPITARIQQRPVSVRGSELAALQYTFIGEPGSMPVSLRQTLRKKTDPMYIQKLFETFGPNWWTQRNARTFSLSQEYDRLLPPHYVVEPASGKNDYVLDGQAPWLTTIPMGEHVSLRNFKDSEPRAGHISLKGVSVSGQSPLRVHWLGQPFSRSVTGRIIATRSSLLKEYTQDMDLFGRPDPLEKLPAVLQETILASHSIIHGDLNLENILVGPGDIIWLIDFAETRFGHPLADFAHLETEIISHIIAPQVENPQEYLKLFDAVLAGKQPTLLTEFLPLLVEIHNIASRCQVDPASPREYLLALFMSCLGAMKYQNLDPHQKHLLYLSAASLIQTL